MSRRIGEKLYGTFKEATAQGFEFDKGCKAVKILESGVPANRDQSVGNVPRIFSRIWDVKTSGKLNLRRLRAHALSVAQLNTLMTFRSLSFVAPSFTARLVRVVVELRT